jgi:hypothetical protein
LAPVALAILVSLNTLSNGWVADDDTQIVKNVALQKLNNIPHSFTSSVWSYATSDILFTVDTYYRPFFMTLVHGQLRNSWPVALGLALN